MTQTSKKFTSLGLDQALTDNLTTLGYFEMTPIQERGLPDILRNRDFIGQANTGSGKTAAFALGILAKLDITNAMPQAMVIVPTRELAEQVSHEIRRLARFSNNIKVLTLCGGTQERHKIKSLKQGAHIVVGTQGRLLKLLETKVLIAFNVHILVLDEADRLLEVGSLEEINRIASFTRADRQTLLFSATFPNGIKELSASLQEDAVQVTIDSQHQNSTIEQIFYKMDEDKNTALLRILGAYQPESCLIFCNSRETCNMLTKLLRKYNMDALHLHSDLEQKDRTLTLVKFSNKSCRILVATDLASRGLDVKDINLIINYELPHNHEQYVHRIGRTGRAGKEGLAVSIYSPKERSVMLAIGEYLKTECRLVDINELDPFKSCKLNAVMATIYISGGKKDNIRPGDILGALTKDAGLDGEDVGKIDILEVNSYAAVALDKIDQAVARLTKGKIKGKKFKVGKT